MKRTPPFPFLPDLETPMRDALRGVANFAEATEEALEPAAQLLPEPLRAGFHRAIKSIETTGKYLSHRDIQHRQIETASAFAAGQVEGRAAAGDFAKVVCFAWEHLQHATDLPRFMISETILVNRCARHSSQGPGAVHAAGLVRLIRKSSAIGRMPGIADGIGSEDRDQIDLALMTVMVWLLAARADTLNAELTLLELAMALATAIRRDIAAAMDDQARVADILAASSAHL